MTDAIISEKDPIEEARKVLEQDKEKRVKDCQVEIQAILTKYNCELVPVIQLQAN